MIFDIYYNVRELFRKKENVLILSYFPPKYTTKISEHFNHLLSLRYYQTNYFYIFAFFLEN